MVRLSEMEDSLGMEDRMVVSEYKYTKSKDVVLLFTVKYLINMGPSSLVPISLTTTRFRMGVGSV